MSFVGFFLYRYRVMMNSFRPMYLEAFSGFGWIDKEETNDKNDLNSVT